MDEPSDSANQIKSEEKPDNHPVTGTGMYNELVHTYIQALFRHDKKIPKLTSLWGLVLNKKIQMLRIIKKLQIRDKNSSCNDLSLFVKLSNS